MATTLTEEKRRQAARILDELDVDLWLLAGRETASMCDPSLELVLDTSVTWVSGFLLHRSGRRIAIVGSGDVDNVELAGGWEVRGYVQGIVDPLRQALRELDPQRIAVNFSPDNHVADGLTHGLYLLLERYLSGTPYASRIVSGEPIASRVRGRKTPAEIVRLRAAVRTTEEIFEALTGSVRPGMTERQVAAFLHEQVDRRGLKTAWDRRYCPRVTCGPNSPVGHVSPSEVVLEPGHLLNIDFGVVQDGYCSDLQRTWYVLRPGESDAPLEVRDAFARVDRAIQAGAAALRPGVAGWEVDAAGRAVLEEIGVRWDFALGHQLGRQVHDGGGVLGPRWERYGERPYDPVEAGQVYTLEIGVSVPGYGFVSLEEDVLVTTEGCEFLSVAQRDVWLVRP